MVHAYFHIGHNIGDDAHICERLDLFVAERDGELVKVVGEGNFCLRYVGPVFVRVVLALRHEPERVAKTSTILREPVKHAAVLNGVELRAWI